jgi:hypothetical protein
VKRTAQHTLYKLALAPIASPPQKKPPYLLVVVGVLDRLDGDGARGVPVEELGEEDLAELFVLSGRWGQMAVRKRMHLDSSG